MKFKTRYFLFGIGAISMSIVIGIALLPPRWSYIFCGVLAFVVGSVVQTEEWKTRKRIRAVVFIVAIAVGGLLTTKGWNELACYSQKKALIVGLAREWLINEANMNKAPMSFDANDPNIGKEHLMYPQFRTSAQDHILTSALFDLRNREDNELLSVIIAYEGMIKDLNVLLTLENEFCMKVSEDSKQQRRKNTYIAVRDRMPLTKNFKKLHKDLLKILLKEYSWAIDEARKASRSSSTN